MSQSNSKKAKRRTRTTSNLSIADAIANVASTTRRKEEPAARRSRFFFTLDEPPPVEVPDEQQPVNEAVVLAINSTKDSLPKSLVPLVDKVRDFFLRELAPLTLAGVTGAQQARTVLSDALETEVDSATEAKFRAMLVKATDLKLLAFVKDYMGLTDRQAQLLYDSIRPANPANIVLPLNRGPNEAPPHKNNRPSKTRHDSQDNKGPQNSENLQSQKAPGGGIRGRGGSLRPRIQEEVDLP